MRIYLDFDLDESYTPTKMKFFAGMSEGGLVEFGNWQVLETIDPMTGEAKSNIDGVRGWIDVPLKGVGGREARYHEIVEDEEDAMELDDERGRKTTKSRKDLASTDRGWPQADTDSEGAGDVLKAMIVQVQVCENHQNGKDTHVRGFQVFARDEAGLKDVRTKMKKQKHKPKSDKLAVEEDTQDGEEEELVGLQPAAWMGDPEVR
jgi:anaphase-promoting complex subunit 10